MILVTMHFMRSQLKCKNRKIYCLHFYFFENVNLFRVSAFFFISEPELRKIRTGQSNENLCRTSRLVRS